MSRETVVEGVVERVTFESLTSGFRVIQVAVPGRADWLPVVGSFPPMHVGTRVRVHGRFEQDRKHGEQLRADSLIELAPDTLAGLEKYLASGVVRGLGPTLASRIVATFGLETLRVLEEEPHRLAAVEGLGEKRRESIARAWREQRAVRDVMIFLQAHGASPALAFRVVRRYGKDAMTVVARNPYRLALDVRGVGFKTADRIAAEMGVARDSRERMEAGTLHVVGERTDAGHLWTSEQEVASRAIDLLGLDREDEAVQRRFRSAIDELVSVGRIALEDAAPPEHARRVYAAEMRAAEVRLAERLTEIAAAPAAGALRGGAAAIAAFERRAGVELAPEQRQAVEQSALRPLLVVTGGPGVGKTTIVRAMLTVFGMAGLPVRLAAPTGRAAKRMSESTGAEATTLHRLLEFDPKTSAFKRDRQRPLEARAVIIDEASMLDVLTADALADAIAPGTRLVLVGDVDQLPSVGPGAVLRDVIASGTVTCVRLRQIFRQASRSLIVTNAHRINDGRPPLATAPAGADDPDFFLVDRRDAEKTRETIVELLSSRIPRRFGLDPVRDVQVLAPMNRGPAGATSLNLALQAALNPSGPSITRGIRTFRVGDKVMQLRNDYDKSVFNGDLGIVSRIEAGDSLIARFEDREVAYESSELDDLVLAYACTVHKAQGSEYPAVVIPLLTSHCVMLSRNLLYTAVTRGRRLVVLVCDPHAVELALERQSDGNRRTALAERLRRAAHTAGLVGGTGSPATARVDAR